GTGPGLTPRSLAEQGGAEKVTLTKDNLGSHTHAASFVSDAGTDINPSGEFLAASPTVRVFRPSAPPDAPFRANSVTGAGGSHSHENLMPGLCVNFIICELGYTPQQ
ncbi:phage tail protein, partial [Planctomycetota bacterium]|nr:phage tail protein [Planctomycetota bacterium]